MSWGVLLDTPIAGGTELIHEFARPWMLWDRTFELAPEPAKRFALGLWNHQIANHKTGAFDRHAPYNRHGPRDGRDFLRHAGFYVHTWAYAYKHTKDKVFLEAIDAVLGRFESKLQTHSSSTELGGRSLPTLSALSMAIDCDGAARKVPEPLRTRLTQFAAAIDQRFCDLPHNLKTEGGFITIDTPTTPKQPEAYTSRWAPSHAGRATTAAVAMMCVSRYQNTGRIGYRKWIVAAADAYLDSMPGANVDAWPMTFGHAISLELAAFRCTTQAQYHRRAFQLGEMAIERFFGDSPLPRASLHAKHYESSTGADTLALALVELHLSTLGITAVRAPANTIDR